jgi:hypothetical protein
MTYLNRVNRVLVANSGAANTGTTRATIANSDILIFNRTMGTALTGGSHTPTSAEGNDRIFIAQGLGGGNLIMGDSNGIQAKGITKVTAAAYLAPTNQITNIGPIAAPTNNTGYRLRIRFLDDQRPAADARPTVRDFYYQTDSSATAIEVAANMVRKVNGDSFLSGKITATLITDGTFTALTNNATVEYNNKSVTSTAHGLAVGDLVRIGGTGATSPVYKVASITSANVFVLDTPYQGTSGTVLAANIGKITASTTASIQLTGRDIAYNGIDLYGRYTFVASLTNDLSTSTTGIETITQVQAPSTGIGFWQSVRDMEYFAQGYLGVTNRILFPGSLFNPATRATIGATYNIVTIEYFDKHTGDRQDQMESPKSLVIAFDIQTATTKYDNFMTTLAGYAEAAGAGVFVS